MSEKSGKIIKTTLAVTFVILLSKLCGFARDIISAAYFGTSMARDAYASAYTLFYVPVLLFNSCITSTVVPLYIRARGSQDNPTPDNANRFACNCINIFAILSLVAMVLMIIFARPLVSLIFGGFSPEKQDLTAQLVRIMLPSLAFTVVSIVLSSVLNANHHYLPAQLTGYPLTITVIVATVFFSGRYGIQAVAWGVFFAGILQVVVLFPWSRKDIRYQTHIDFRDPALHQLLILAIPAILSMAVNELNHIIDKSICSYLNPGDPSSMDYAYRLITFAIGVLAVPITTIMFSRISEKFAAGDKPGIQAILSQSLQVLCMILLPVTAVGCVMSQDIIKLAYMRGNFRMDSVLVTSGVFLFYLIGILSFALRDLFNRVFHAMEDTRTPMICACVSVVTNVVLNLILSRYIGVNGLALATTISCSLGAVLLACILKKRLGLGSFALSSSFRELGKIILASVACLGVSFLLNFLIPQATSTLTLLLRLIAVTGGSLIVYVGLLIVLRAEELEFVASTFLRRLHLKH